MASIFRGPLFTRYQRYAALTSLAAVLACPSPNLLATTLKPATAQAPFAQTAWPNPQTRTRATDLLTQCDATEFWLLKDTFFRGPGQAPNYDWPNPALRSFPIDNRTECDSSEFWLFGPVAKPFSPVDWQNPLIAGRAPVGFAAPSSQQTILAPAVTAVPFTQEDWPNPTLRVRPAVTTLSSIFYYIIDDNNPPATVVWPNPALQSFPLDNRTIADGTEYWLLAPVTQAVPFAQTDWPNPRIATVPLEGRTIADPSEFWFLKDTFFGGPGQPPTYLAQPNPRIATVPTDARTWTFTLPINVLGAIQPTPTNLTDWPNPRGYRPVISLRTQAEFTRLLGKDKIFGGPGQPITIWPQPNPLGYRYPTDLRTGFARQTLTTAIAALDPACIIRVESERWIVVVPAELFTIDPEDD